MDLDFALSAAPLAQPTCTSHQDEHFPQDKTSASSRLSAPFHHRTHTPSFIDSSSTLEPEAEQGLAQRATSYMSDTVALASRPCALPDDPQPGTDRITYPGCDGNIVSIHGLHASIIETRCPLLAAAFEKSRFGQHLHLDTLSSQTAEPFVRFLNTGSYAVEGDWHDVPTSVLLHCKMYNLADIYGIPELCSQAYVNILRQCEFGCSSPDKPIDLCAAIKFTYANLSKHPSIADAIVQYCVSRFLSHRLGDDAGFRELAYEVRAFHQDLVKACRDRGFEDESAGAIIQLPYKPYAPETYASIERPAIAHFDAVINDYNKPHRRHEEEASPRKKVRLSDIESDGTKEKNPDDDQLAEHRAQVPITFGPSLVTEETDPPRPDRVTSLPIRHRSRFTVEKPTATHQEQRVPLWKRRSIGTSRDLLTQENLPQFVKSLWDLTDDTEDDIEQQPLLKEEEREDEEKPSISYAGEGQENSIIRHGTRRGLSGSHLEDLRSILPRELKSDSPGARKSYFEMGDTKELADPNPQPNSRQVLRKLADNWTIPCYALDKAPNDFQIVNENELGTEAAQQKFEALKALDELTESLRIPKIEALPAEKYRGKGKEKASLDERHGQNAIDAFPQPPDTASARALRIRKILEKASSSRARTEKANQRPATMPVKAATPSPKAEEREGFELVGLESSSNDVDSDFDDWVDVPLETARKAPEPEAARPTVSKHARDESVAGASSESEWELC